MRKIRKLEHIELYIRDFKNLNGNTFGDFHFVHNSLPETNINSINIETIFFDDLKSQAPFYINAITGGISQSKEINKAFARISKELGIPMAVGSQYIALEDKSVSDTFKIVREINPNGIIFANAGAMISAESANKIIDMIEADALQIHLNVPQEVIMSEGDRCFEGYLSNIEKLAKDVEIPIIVKEVGFGISGNTAKVLEDIGVKAIDIGGRGGTNFIKIESMRSRVNINRNFLQWGIPTAISLVECIKSTTGKLDIMASGGIWDGVSIAKALSLGADSVGIAGFLLYLLVNEGESEVIKILKNIEEDLILCMLMLGAKNIDQLKESSIVITGDSKEWLEQRGYDLSCFARR